MRSLFVVILFVYVAFPTMPGRAASLPHLSIETTNRAPVSSKTVKLPAELRLSSPGSEAELALTAEVRAHGNSSLGFPKKSMNLELAEKRSFLGFSPEKEWVLLANYSDKNLLRNFLAYELSRSLGARYAPRARFVDLTLNGDFQGNFLLVERIKIAASRLDLGKLGPGDTSGEALTGGYLMEIYHKGQEKFHFVTKQGLIFNLKSPKDPAPEQFAYIHDYVQAAEDALFAPDFGDYDRFLDVDQFIAWYLVNELFRNQDAATYASIYVHKPRGGKLAMGPVWDFDIAAGNVDYDDNFLTDGWWIQARSPWFRRLFEHPEFQARVKARWREIRLEQVEQLFRLISLTARELDESSRANFERWPILNEKVWPNYVVMGSYAGEVEYLRDWLRRRVQWLDTQWGE